MRSKILFERNQSTGRRTINTHIIIYLVCPIFETGFIENQQEEFTEFLKKFWIPDVVKIFFYIEKNFSGVVYFKA